MNKKQVAAFLKVMSKDISRPVICAAHIEMLDDKQVMVATDGYKLSAIYLDETIEELNGKLIRRTAFERWYKLADGKSRLTATELQTLLNDDFALNDGYLDGQYPEWQKLIPKEVEPQGGMHFNADYVKIIQDLNGDESVSVDLYGSLAPMVVRHDVSLSLIMPMKK